MDDTQGTRIIEALLFVFSQPLALKRITELLPDLDATAVRRLIASLAEEYRTSHRAFQIQEVAGGYQLVTDQALAPWVKRALQSPKPDSVSAAALETLAIIAYRQPITKAEIEAIRGVDVTASLDTLVERRFVRIAGRKETPGRPFVYATTPEFLRHFGLKSLQALPRPDHAQADPGAAQVQPASLHPSTRADALARDSARRQGPQAASLHGQ